jgi:hypothetical protein
MDSHLQKLKREYILNQTLRNFYAYAKARQRAGLDSRQCPNCQCPYTIEHLKRQARQPLEKAYLPMVTDPATGLQMTIEPARPPGRTCSLCGTMWDPGASEVALALFEKINQP